MNKLKSIITAGALAAASVVAAPAEAAHQTVYLYHGKDVGWFKGWSGGMNVMDRECDGHAVRIQARWHDEFDNKGTKTLKDTGCRDGSAGEVEVPGLIMAARVCEQFPDGWRCRDWWQVHFDG